MSNIRRFTSKTKGFTLLELMVVIAIFTMIMAVGGPSFSRMIERNQLQAATSDLTMQIIWARSEAVKRNAKIRMYRYTNSVASYVYATSGGTTTLTSLYNVGGQLQYEPGIYQTGPSYVDFYPNGRVDVVGTLKQFELTKTDGEEAKRCVYISAGGVAKAMTDKNEDGNCANG